MRASQESGSPLWIKILKLGLPILIGQLGMIVVGFADTKMVGLYSTASLASASFVNNLFNTAIFACIGFTYGLTPLVGALFSQKRYGEIGAMVRSGLLVNALFTLIPIAVMTVVYFNLHRLGQPEELLPLIRPYFLIYLAGVLPISVFNVFAQWSYAINRTRMPMWIILAANVVNIAGNYVLIYGNFGFPELGLTGAGIATLLSRVLCMVAIILVFATGKAYRPYFKGFMGRRASSGTFRRINVTSWPVSLQMMFESGSFTAAAIMAGWLGAVSLAAFQVIVIIGTLGFCVYYSMAAAVSVLVANAAGQNDCGLMRRTAMSGYRILLILATCSSALFIFCGPAIMHQFTRDPRCSRLRFADCAAGALSVWRCHPDMFANALRGTSNVMPMLWISLVCYVVIGVPSTYLLGFVADMGSYGIILSFSVSLFLAAAMFLVCFFRTTRRIGATA